MFRKAVFFIFLSFFLSSFSAPLYAAYGPIPVSTPVVSSTVNFTVLGTITFTTPEGRTIADAPVYVNLQANDYLSASRGALRIFSRNGDAAAPFTTTIGIGLANASGLINSTVTTERAPFKVWTANFGPSASVPDPDNYANWTNYWGWVLDWQDPGLSADHAGAEILNGQYEFFDFTEIYSWGYTGDPMRPYQDFPACMDLSNIPLYFAADFARVLPGLYRSRVYFEYVVE